MFLLDSTFGGDLMSSYRRWLEGQITEHRLILKSTSLNNNKRLEVEAKISAYRKALKEYLDYIEY
jgi:hypothetical protein